MPSHIIVSDEELTRTIVMRRPEKKNALTHEMLVAISEAIDTAQSDPAIRCLILTGRSGVFSAGADLADRLKDAAADQGPGKPRGAAALLQSLINNKKPIIAAVDGAAVGTGAAMVLHCDYVIASTTSSFSSPLTRFGLPPEGASSLLLPLVAGHQRAFSTLVMGHPMSAEEARQAGIVNVVVPPGHAINEAQRIAREICELPPDVVASSRQLLRLSPKDLQHRMDQEEHLLAERLSSPSVTAEFKKFLARNEG
jgi:enoyl-CoA hydratase/carnithine racemase